MELITKQDELIGRTIAKIVDDYESILMVLDDGRFAVIRSACSCGDEDASLSIEIEDDPGSVTPHELYAMGFIDYEEWKRRRAEAIRIQQEDVERTQRELYESLKAKFETKATQGD